jgi:protein ImuB
MRIVAIVLPDLALEVTRKSARTREPSASSSVASAVSSSVASAVILASRAGMTEADLTGNVRLHSVCEHARAEGIAPGHTLAAARARLSELSVSLVTEDALEQALARIAEAALAFGATVSFARGTEADDTVWIDVTGCAHLFAGPMDTEGSQDPLEEGENRLLARLEGTVRALGHTCRIALANGPRVARAVARFGRHPDVVGVVDRVPPGRDREAIAALPIDSLPLDASRRDTLLRLGIRSAGELLRLPRAALGARLGAQSGEVMQLLDGDDRAPLTPYVPKKPPAESLELDHGTDSLEALGFVVKTLVSRLALRLEGRGVGVVKLSLVLDLDVRAVGLEQLEGKKLDPKQKRAKRVSVVTLPTPVSNPKELFVVLRARLERTLLPAPVLALTLRADECRPRPEVPRSLFESESREARALPMLVAELSAELGEDAIGRLEIGDSWSYAERSRLVPFFAPRSPAPANDPVPSPQASPEPSVLLPTPMPVDRRLVSAFRFVARYESLAWWRGGGALHDVVAATLEGRAALVDLDKSNGVASVVGWLD